MTSAALQRASAFAEVDKRVVEIRTLSPWMNPKRRRSALLASKKIGRRVDIRNLWSELRTMPEKQIIRSSRDHETADHHRRGTALDHWSGGIHAI